MNSFQLDGYKQLFFDIFFKNNKIYLICPIYNDEIDINKLKVSINENDTLIILPLQHAHKKIEYEAIEILVYYFFTSSKTVNISVEYLGIKKNYTLENINININKKLSITTLFKDDYFLFPIFYKYYKSQGVQHFYMYYNGLITEDIKKLFDYSDVSLIEWDFQYWNDKTCQYYHHAQMGQLHHALYRYGKENSEYMIFCDLDEYLHTPGKYILDTINTNKDIDVFGFCNLWAQTKDNTIPKEFPTKFLVGEKMIYTLRSKNMYKVSAISTLSIHHPRTFTRTPNTQTDYLMFHFHSWGDNDRKEEVIYNYEYLL